MMKQNPTMRDLRETPVRCLTGEQCSKSDETGGL